MNRNIDRTAILNLKTMENIGDIGLLQKYHNTLCCPSNILLKNIFLNFSWDLRQSPPRETENNAFGGTTKSIIMVFWKRPIHSRRSEIHNNMRKLIVTSLLNCWPLTYQFARWIIFPIWSPFHKILTEWQSENFELLEGLTLMIHAVIVKFRVL